ncbi:MAG TPA: ABC transporter ATP-binding protein [Streptosporangiaceae bacterium]
MNQPLLSLRGLKTHFFGDEGTVSAVNGVTLDIPAGQAVGVVGESGCGKSVMARSILRIVEQPGRIVAGEILLRKDDAEIDLAKLPANGEAMRSIRGGDISLVFQEPMTSFSPVHTAGNQLIEVLRLHRGLSKEKAYERAVDLLRMVDVPSPEKVMDSYAWQLSGGIRQRAMIAMALSGEPRLLIADEPTTALDVTTQAQILDLIRDLKRDTGMALMLITHDLAVVAGVADYVVVMYLGEVVERGTVEEIFGAPQHPYTQALLRSIPSISGPPRIRLHAIAGSVPHPFDRPSGCSFHPRCPVAIQGTCDTVDPPLRVVGEGHEAVCHLVGEGQPGSPIFTMQDLETRLPALAREPESARDTMLEVRGLGKSHALHASPLARKRAKVRAVDDVNFELRAGETLALVGESGSGKTTVSRCILRAIQPDSGEIVFRTQAGDRLDLAGLRTAQLRPLRNEMQMIFQDPYSSLNPRMTVFDIIAEPLRVDGAQGKQEQVARVLELLELVGLPREYMRRYPHAFSGGQRQRIGIARALALRPRLIVADEPVSALDVSVQAQILNLLLELQGYLGLTYIFVSHDLSVVRHVSDRIAVMYAGNLVELGHRDEVMESPRHPYTATLLAAIPKPEPRATTSAPPHRGTRPNLIDPPVGCYFESRCPYAVDRCKAERPTWQEITPGRWVRCHRYGELALSGIGADLNSGIHSVHDRSSGK